MGEERDGKEVEGKEVRKEVKKKRKRRKGGIRKEEWRPGKGFWVSSPCVVIGARWWC
jgi:hypothetical protein